LSRCKENIEGGTVGYSIRKYYARWAWSKYFKCMRGTLLSSEEDRIPEEFYKRLCQVGIEHIHKVIEYPKILSNKFLE
jgi:hypothetical protein